MLLYVALAAAWACTGSVEGKVVQRGQASTTQVIASWPWYSNAQFARFVGAVYAVPGGRRLVVRTDQGCFEPRFTSLEIP